jgi:acyl-CoA dehydrogenase
VLLEDCTIPVENVLGGMEKLEARLARAREGTHSRSSGALKTFELSRPIVGAQALGIARAAFEFALQYAKERKQFGRALIENEAIAFMLADMATEIEATRALIWRALWEGRNGGEFKKAEGSMAKLKAGEVAVKVTEQAIQICGGYGYIRDFPVEKWHRDAKIYTLFEGTSEIQRIVISRALAKN